MVTKALANFTANLTYEKLSEHSISMAKKKPAGLVGSRHWRLPGRTSKNYS